MKVITFSGVDGAGKTTILREFTVIIQKKYNFEVKELRHRPSMLPILSAIKYGKEKASEKSMEVLPRTGTNKSKVSSYVRFFYYLIDYFIGQWVIYFKYTRKNIVVIYDRYYFDFINDSRRSNIDLNKNFVKFFYNFLLKHHFNIFLYASPKVILSRKKELDSETIEMLTDDYLSLFNEYSKSKKEIYRCIENINKKETLDEIEKLFKKII